MDVNYFSVQWLLRIIQVGFVRCIFLRLSVFNQEEKALRFLIQLTFCLDAEIIF